MQNSMATPHFSDDELEKILVLYSVKCRVRKSKSVAKSSCNVSFIFFKCVLFDVTSFRWHFVSIVYSVSELWSVWQWLAWSQFTRSKPERCSIWTNVNTSSYVTDNLLVTLLGNQEHFVEESILYILCKNVLSVL